MNKTALTICIGFLVLCGLALGGCRKSADGKGSASGTSAKTESSPEAVVEIPSQQQSRPKAEDFSVTEQQKEARGATTVLPADWPALLRLPDGSSITQATSREGIMVVEFKISQPLLEVNAGLAAGAAAAGYKLHQAEIDKYSQSRSYTSDANQYNVSLTEADGAVFGNLTLKPLEEGQYFSETTHYSGEFSLPGSWPKDILPIFDGCVLRELHIPLQKGGRLMLSAQSNADEADIIAWLEQELPGRGWTASGSTSRNGFSIREYTGNGYNLNVAARGNEGLTDIQYEASGI